MAQKRKTYTKKSQNDSPTKEQLVKDFVNIIEEIATKDETPIVTTNKKECKIVLIKGSKSVIDFDKYYITINGVYKKDTVVVEYEGNFLSKDFKIIHVE